jgi:hypothetical protein
LLILPLKVELSAICNFSPDFKIVAEISSLNELILADPFLATP